MDLFDTHCHFDAADDIAAILERARAAGLVGLVAVGGDDAANAGARLAARLAPGFAFPALGLDWSCASAPDAADAAQLAAAEDGFSPASAQSAIAAGEIGLDYSHGPTAAEKAAQRALFARQVAAAAEVGMPCSVHSREAEEDTFAILRECVSPTLAAEGRAGSLHCFVGPASFAERLLPLGFSFGLSGILTFRNADSLRAAVPAIPRERLLLETDSPYLAPVPMRGRKCEPAFVAHTVRVLGKILGIEPDEAAGITTENAMRLFCPKAQR